MFCKSPPCAMARMENSVRRKNNTLDKNQRAFMHLLDIVTPVGALKTVIYACVKNGPEASLRYFLHMHEYSSTVLVVLVVTRSAVTVL
jgi:hypothetical protein